MGPDVDIQTANGPFEGPEKLLEIWFAPSSDHVPDANGGEGRTGLRVVEQEVWREMLSIVKCEVLSIVEGEFIDAYLLSESSLFVFPHKVILKTCGTTLNLLGLPRILEIARSRAYLPDIYQFFYSRKSFMFPERQTGPHKGWQEEIAYLDAIFTNGAAYTVGKVNGDHWLLYVTSPGFNMTGSIQSLPPSPITSLAVPNDDFTFEMLMTDLAPEACAPFYTPELDLADSGAPLKHGQELSEKIGIAQLFPQECTTLDAYSFTPCGYSSNALIKAGKAKDGSPLEGYYTIHVTPEPECSYASFECNVPLSLDSSSCVKRMLDLRTLARRVVSIFRPGRITMTVFMSSDNDGDGFDVERAQRAFKEALAIPVSVKGGSGASTPLSVGYRRTDKINYEFAGYDLAFASFELQ